MEENEKKEEKISANAEELKKETVETAQKVKENLKNTNIKEETKATKGLLVDMFKDPIGKIKEVAHDTEGKYFKTALILIIVWIILVFIKATYSTIHHYGLIRVFSNLLSILKVILAPALGIGVLSLITYLYGNKNKKTLPTIISTITITKIPVIIGVLVSLLTIFSYDISLITNPFVSLCSVISIVLGFFGLKHLFDEECSTFIKKYVLIQVVYYACSVLIGLLQINI